MKRRGSPAITRRTIIQRSSVAPVDEGTTAMLSTVPPKSWRAQA
jgi:hypothetical protein